METSANKNDISHPGDHSNPFSNEDEYFFYAFSHIVHTKHPKTLLKTGAFESNFKSEPFENPWF